MTIKEQIDSIDLIKDLKIDTEDENAIEEINLFFEKEQRDDCRLKFSELLYLTSFEGLAIENNKNYPELLEDEIYATDKLNRIITDLYKNNFGINLDMYYECMDNPNNNISIIDFYNNLYAFITTYYVSEKDFLEDLQERVKERNTKMLKELTESINTTSDIISSNIHQTTLPEDDYYHKTVVLKSTNPEEYGNLQLNCISLDNYDLEDLTFGQRKLFGESITYTRKANAVNPRPAKNHEVIKTTIKHIINGKEYYQTIDEKEAIKGDIVVKQKDNYSQEETLVSEEEFLYYDYYDEKNDFVAPEETKSFMQAKENIVIEDYANSKTLIAPQGSYLSISDNGIEVIPQNDFTLMYEVTKQKEYK